MRAKLPQRDQHGVLSHVQRDESGAYVIPDPTPHGISINGVLGDVKSGSLKDREKAVDGRYLRLTLKLSFI